MYKPQLKYVPEIPLKLDPSLPLAEKLRRLGIRHYGEPIHDQSKEWLIEQFDKNADKYPVNVSLLFRNLIWQTRARIKKGSLAPVKELVRSFWYLYIKPTLSRCGSLSNNSRPIRPDGRHLRFHG